MNATAYGKRRGRARRTPSSGSTRGYGGNRAGSRATAASSASSSARNSRPSPSRRCSYHAMAAANSRFASGSTRMGFTVGEASTQARRARPTTLGRRLRRPGHLERAAQFRRPRRRPRPRPSVRPSSRRAPRRRQPARRRSGPRLRPGPSALGRSCLKCSRPEGVAAGLFLCPPCAPTLHRRAPSCGQARERSAATCPNDCAGLLGKSASRLVSAWTVANGSTPGASTVLLSTYKHLPASDLPCAPIVADRQLQTPGGVNYIAPSVLGVVVVG